MGKRTCPQGWEKPTYFMYSSRIQKIYQEKKPHSFGLVQAMVETGRTIEPGD